MILERSKTNEAMPLMASDYCLERVSGPRQRAEELKARLSPLSSGDRVRIWGRLGCSKAPERGKMLRQERAVHLEN